MPLTPYELLGHDEERLAFRFSMLNDDQVVLCQISDAALDEPTGTKGTEPIARMAQFLSLAAKKSNKPPHGLFDEGPARRGSVVRIFARHIALELGEAAHSQPSGSGE